MYICSNTDLSGTGASVLQHRHYQLVAKRMAVCDANAKLHTTQTDGAQQQPLVEFLDFPVAAARLTHVDKDVIVAAGAALLDAWRGHEMAKVLTAPVEEQTSSYICALLPATADRQATYELIVIPRTQGRMTRSSLRCIKSEFVGILEMAGFAILPGRLKKELTSLLIEGKQPEGELEAYKQWMGEMGVKTDPTASNLLVSDVATQALCDCFVAILEDNSGFDSTDLVTAKKWLSLSGFST
eukprot:m.123665 g.123665  ORF g.123665 m.123665 type:complete len:241 (-) comp29005_c0_seq1:109-831(-)